MWEVGCLSQRHGSDGTVELAVCEEPASAVVTISGIDRAAIVGNRPGEPPDRLDLAGLRQLVDTVETQVGNGSVSVRLTSSLDDDAWVPGTTELAHVLGSL